MSDGVKNVFLGFVAFCEAECLFCMWLSCLRDDNDASAFFCYCLSPLSCPIFNVFSVGYFSCFVCMTFSLFLSIENSVLGSVCISVPSRSQLYGSLPVSLNVCFSRTPHKLSKFFLFLILWWLFYLACRRDSRRFETSCLVPVAVSSIVCSHNAIASVLEEDVSKLLLRLR
jgi:hypothetical protein